MFRTWSTRRAASVDDSIRALVREASPRCHFLKSGLRDNASIKTFDFPGLYLTRKLNYERNVSHLAIIGDMCSDFIAVRSDL